MKDRDDIEALIDRWVAAENFGGKPTLDLKVALLSLVLEQLKYERQTAEDVVDFETYFQSKIFADTDKLIIAAPLNEKRLGAGKAPIQLQAALLVFLLLHHRNDFPVLEIIKRFIGKVRPQLEFLDFKKNKNRRDALLHEHPVCRACAARLWPTQVHPREAYKTWELSLTGFLVAADIFHKRSKENVHWNIPANDKEKGVNFDLLPEIRAACDEINSYDAFVARLASICKPDAEVFTSFKEPLEKAYFLLKDYWAILKKHESDPEGSARSQLGADSKTGTRDHQRRFYEEFSQCIQINELLAKIPQQPQQG